MATMTRTTRRQIQAALDAARRAQAYLDQADVAVGRLDRPASTSLHYTRADGSTFYAMDKRSGSDLVGLAECIRLLVGLVTAADNLNR